MIYITGDTHGNVDFDYLKDYFNNRFVNENDYLIILGDAGIVWSGKENFIDDYAMLGLNVLFIDGNHENFELLNRFPIVTFNGAKCHKLYENVYHIMRGEIIKLNNKTFFCMGGARSIDKVYRIENISWWKEEDIGFNDIENGLSNLKNVQNTVDYVLTHCAPTSIINKMFNYKQDNNTKILEKFKEIINFKYWYFGHYHENKKYNNFEVLYRRIIILNDETI